MSDVDGPTAPGRTESAGDELGGTADALGALAANPARAAERRRSDELVAALTERLDRERFAALVLVARAQQRSAQQRSAHRERTARPSHANVHTAHTDGYLDGLLDAACLLLGCDPPELHRALEQACRDLDYVGARNRLLRPPHLWLSGRLAL